MKSRFLTVDKKDIIRSFVLAVITAMMTTLYEVLLSGTIDAAALKSVMLSGAAASVGYVLKNFLTNSKDEMLKRER